MILCGVFMVYNLCVIVIAVRVSAGTSLVLVCMVTILLVYLPCKFKGAGVSGKDFCTVRGDTFCGGNVVALLEWRYWRTGSLWRYLDGITGFNREQRRF